MSAQLNNLPDGSNVLIDTNIFVYALTNKSAQCKSFLARCSREEVSGLTLFDVINEATHIFMGAEAIAKNMSARKPIAYLQKNPDQVKLLADYWVNTQRVLALNLLKLPTEENIVVRAQQERDSAGLLTTDSVIVAAMREYGVTMIATGDKQFDSVAGISVFTPTDI